MKRNPYLRVKLKSLAAEAKIIRIEEQRANKYKDYATQTELHRHRIDVVRHASRHTLLAYQFLRGVPYEAVEKPNSKYVDWSNVLRMVHKYHSHSIKLAELKDWSSTKLKKAA